MISAFQAIQIHELLIAKFGGSLGIRDRGALTSALSRPFQIFEGKELYPSILQKSAALIESILANHPFVDGNKRTGYVLMRVFLLNNGYDIIASQNEKYEFLIRIASGKSNFNDIIYWLENFTKMNGS